MIARGKWLWPLALTLATAGCQADEPHIAIQSLLSLNVHQVEVDGEPVVDELVPDQTTHFVEVSEHDEPLWIDLYYVAINGEPSPQAFEVSDFLGDREPFDCWLVYLEPCDVDPASLCVAAQRTEYDGLIRGCSTDPL